MNPYPFTFGTPQNDSVGNLEIKQRETIAKIHNKSFAYLQYTTPKCKHGSIHTLSQAQPLTSCFFVSKEASGTTKLKYLLVYINIYIGPSLQQAAISHGNPADGRMLHAPKPLFSLQGAATFSIASGAISSPMTPGSLPSTPSSRSTSSQFLAGPCSMAQATINGCIEHD